MDDKLAYAFDQNKLCYKKTADGLLEKELAIIGLKTVCAFQGGYAFTSDKDVAVHVTNDVINPISDKIFGDSQPPLKEPYICENWDGKGMHILVANTGNSTLQFMDRIGRFTEVQFKGEPPEKIVRAMLNNGCLYVVTNDCTLIRYTKSKMMA